MSVIAFPARLSPFVRRSWLHVSSAATLALVLGCATHAPDLPISPLPLPEATATAVDRLVAQASGPAWLSAWQSRSLVIEPIQDAADGGQTRSTAEVRRQLAERLHSTRPGLEQLPLREGTLAHATWTLRGVLATGSAAEAGAERKAATLRLTLVEIATGALVAQTSVPVQAETIDDTPTSFFQDSPVLTNTSKAATPPGTPAPQLEALNVAALLDQGMQAYDNHRYDEALPLFEAAARIPSADGMPAEIGLYLTHSQLGAAELAKQDFGRLVDIGLARRSLAVKFLFEPGKVEFWSDPRVSGPYAMWLQQIAARAADTGTCLVIVGHSSRTGTETFNDQLSLDRATRIGDALTLEAPQLGSRLDKIGRGYRDNLVGSGTDDARDALDRRVEFRFRGC